jgi:parallel beta-helix repeat protein
MLFSWKERLLQVFPKSQLRQPSCRPTVEHLEDRLAPATYKVIGTGDGIGAVRLVDPVNDIYTVTTLRRAIAESNRSVGVRDVIEFDIPGVPTITPGKALPTITDPVTIDGTTQKGYDAKNFIPIVTLDGSKAGQANGLTITTDGSTIKGLIVINFERNAIEIKPASITRTKSQVITKGGDGNRILNTILGTNGASGNGLGNSTGVFINGTKNNIIGGVADAERNIISGNKEDGVRILSLNTNQLKAIHQNNQVIGNYVGTDVGGMNALPNGRNGVRIEGGDSNIIDRNVIAGNTDAGVYITLNGKEAEPDPISDPLSVSNVVRGNLIGLAKDGMTPLGNSVGVQLTAGTTDTLIGGGAPADRNIISGNGTGILLTFSGKKTDEVDLRLAATANKIYGNYIGLDQSGEAEVGNTTAGIAILDSSNNEIGGLAAGQGNVISGNNTGISIAAMDATGNIVLNNIIGLSASGKDLGNKQKIGVSITISAQHQLGYNTISGNADVGILITGDASQKNRVFGNKIGTGLDGKTGVGSQAVGILLEDEANQNFIGRNFNDPATDRNIISGNSEYGIELKNSNENKVFSNYLGTDVTGAKELPNGKYGVYLHDGSSGNDFYDNTISGNQLSGIAIKGAKTSNIIEINRIGLDSTGKKAVPNGLAGKADGHGVLIDGAAGNQLIGNFIGGNKQDGVHIEGGTAKNNTIRGNLIGTNADGSAAVANRHGVVITGGASQNVIGGAFPFNPAVAQGNLISGNRRSGVLVNGGPGKNQIFGNFIGTDAAGTGKLPNGTDLLDDGNGIFIRNSPDNVIGGADRRGNVVSGNKEDGIRIQGAGATGNKVLSNSIGTTLPDPLTQMVQPLGNDGNGIVIAGGKDNIVGDKDLGNIIAANGGDGVVIRNLGASKATGNKVQFNKIGTDAQGNKGNPASFANTNGVFIAAGSTRNTIAQDRIAFNNKAGIRDENPANSNTFTKNSITENGNMGIDVAEEDVTTDNLPDISTAVFDKKTGKITITGQMTSTDLKGSFTIELFGNAECDVPYLHGEGDKFIASIPNVSGNTGKFSITVDYDPAWKTITATATIPGEGTAEFSECLDVDEAPEAKEDCAIIDGQAQITINVLANDTDADGDQLRVTAYDAVSAHGGQVGLLDNGSLTYAPPPGYQGIDTFTYTIGDGRGGFSTATVTVMPPGFYVVPGENGSSTDVTFTFTSREAAFRNQFGYVIVDDDQGRIDGLLPTDPGYARAALARAQTQNGVVFDDRVDLPGATKTVSLPAGSRLIFFLAQDSTLDQALASNPDDTMTGSPHVWFSVDAANPDAQTRHVLRTESADCTAGLSWEDLNFGGDRDYNDMVVSIAQALSGGIPPLTLAALASG